MFPKTNYHNFVTIHGQIKNPGKYPFSDNLTIADLINATLSTKDKEFYKTMNLENHLP